MNFKKNKVFWNKDIQIHVLNMNNRSENIMKNFSMVITFTMVLFSCAPPEPIIIEVPVEKKDKLTLEKFKARLKKA